MAAGERDLVPSGDCDWALGDGGAFEEEGGWMEGGCVREAAFALTAVGETGETGETGAAVFSLTTGEEEEELPFFS